MTLDIKISFRSPVQFTRSLTECLIFCYGTRTHPSRHCQRLVSFVISNQQGYSIFMYGVISVHGEDRVEKKKVAG